MYTNKRIYMLTLKCFLDIILQSYSHGSPVFLKENIVQQI